MAPVDVLEWGTCWHEDETLAVFDRARAICRKASAECGDAKMAAAVRLAAARTAVAVEILALSWDRRHATTIEQWDADAWLLNTPAGTVDLRTGELNDHRREQYLTKITAAGLAGIARCGGASSIALPMANPNCRRSYSVSLGTV